ncbi:MAG TPA: methyltransferase type 11 [Sphingobacteriaceae bacterium]
MQVEVFRTNVNLSKDASKIVKALNSRYPDSKINFDLDDCDKILRIEADQDSISCVSEIVAEHGFECELLKD